MFIFVAPQKDTLCAAIKEALLLFCFYYSISDLDPPKLIGTSGGSEKLKNLDQLAFFIFQRANWPLICMIHWQTMLNKCRMKKYMLSREIIGE